MSVTCGFYNSLNHDRRYDAVQMSSIFDGIIKDGIFESIGTAMMVVANEGMTVNVGAGRAWFNSTWTLNDADLPLTLDDGELVLDRIDAIVLEVDATESVRQNTIKVVKGTPASTPTKPELINTSTVHQYALAYITVRQGATSITQANIENAVGTEQTPFITGILETMSIDGLVEQWMVQWQEKLIADEASFVAWKESLREILDDATASRLADMITEVRNSFIICTVECNQELQGRVITGTSGAHTATAVVNSDNQAIFHLPITGDWTFEEPIAHHTKSINIPYYGNGYSTQLKSYLLYGFKIAKADSNPATRVSYIAGCDNENYARAYMDFSSGHFNYGDWEDAFFMPRPCMLKYDGTVDYYLNPNNYGLKENGVASDIANTNYNGNAMMEFPLNYMYCYEDANYEYCYISDVEYNENYKCYEFYNKDGDIMPYSYRAIYPGSEVSGKVRSLSGRSPMASNTAQQERTKSQANGTYWDMEYFSFVQMIRNLLVLIGKSTDSQATFGYGNAPGSQSVSNTGRCDTKGLFYGTSGSNADGVKIFGMEHFWGNQWHRLIGWLNVNGTQKVKMTYGRQDGTEQTDFDFVGTGYKVIQGATPAGSSGGYINTIKMTEFGPIPVTANGASNTYYADGMWFNNGQTDVACVGGSSYYALTCGVFASDLGYAASISHWHIGCALSCKPAVA